MRYKNTIEAVYFHLDEIQQLVAKIGSDGNIYTIDVDLAMEKTRTVYDLMLALKQESTSLQPKITIKEDEIFIPVKPFFSKTESDTVETLAKPIATKEVESAAIEKQADEEKKTQEKPISKAAKTEQAADQKKYLGETFTKIKPSFNEELSQQTSKIDIGSHLKLKPISSLTAAIGINEKFELIQNLFGGDKVKYEQTINILNTFHSYSEASHYIADNFNWDSDNAYAKRILELLQRKHLTGGNEQ